MFGRVLAFPSPAEGAKRGALTTLHEPPLISLADTAPSPVWVRDLAHARALHESPTGAAALALLVTRERDLLRRREVLEPYCRELWRAVPILAHPELLECVFWGDQLTLALVAARDWGSALARSIRIAKLPRRARLDAARGLRRRVARRASRCRRMLRTPARPARPHTDGLGR